jgi:hypothetical protein
MQTLHQRIEVVLQQGSPVAYCFACLATKLTVPTKEVLDAAQLLVLDPRIRVHQGVCLACERWERVIRMIGPTGR